MAYVDEKEQKYEVQYCVVLREGKNAGKRQEFHVPKEKLQKIFDSCKFDNNGEVFMYVGHIAGNKRGERADEVYFDKKRIGSLEIRAKNEETANKCAAYFKLPLPFSNYEKN